MASSRQDLTSYYVCMGEVKSHLEAATNVISMKIEGFLKMQYPIATLSFKSINNVEIESEIHIQVKELF